MLALGRYSRWPRSELRSLSAQEFADYFAAAEELIEDTQDFEE